MSHFAKIDSNNVVTQVIVAEQDFIDTAKLGDPSLWIQTSYNNNFRKQFAGIGSTYDKINDVFISPKPFPSWTLDTNFDWQPPVADPHPERCTVNSLPCGTCCYRWDEDNLTWIDPSA